MINKLLGGALILVGGIYLGAIGVLMYLSVDIPFTTSPVSWLLCASVLGAGFLFVFDKE